ncbi:Conserved hypothetical protein [Pseudonocardia thermophila]|jgi:Conserved hypothetical protein (DUF2461).|uniref:TIGR02453 family protein n=1 Tax=Pseudonocardia thermophila TaxID=1848 RepID=A0A1M6Q5G5_PSETH|nr:DUF2461 family protein [Pseudonocardia thermophila]SHK15425.1 Conserved hypothetical protein [Pseudonocardia thermophila]
MPTTSVFTGWPTDAVVFLREIAADNTAEFWTAQRHRYDAGVRPPTVALAGALTAEFGPVRVLRPHRNRRFHPTVPPYRTDTGGVARTAGGTERSFVLSAAGLAVTVGRFAFAGAALRRYREAVAGPAGEQLVAALVRAEEAGLWLDPAPAQAAVPRGCPRDHPRAQLLARRALRIGAAWPAGPWLSTHEPLARVAGAWRAATPVVEWLDTEVPADG